MKAFTRGFLTVILAIIVLLLLAMTVDAGGYVPGGRETIGNVRAEITSVATGMVGRSVTVNYNGYVGTLWTTRKLSVGDQVIIRRATIYSDYSMTGIKLK